MRQIHARDSCKTNAHVRHLHLLRRSFGEDIRCVTLHCAREFARSRRGLSSSTYPSSRAIDSLNRHSHVESDRSTAMFSRNEIATTNLRESADKKNAPFLWAPSANCTIRDGENDWDCRIRKSDAAHALENQKAEGVSMSIVRRFIFALHFAPLGVR